MVISWFNAVRARCAVHRTGEEQDSAVWSGGGGAKMRVHEDSQQWPHLPPKCSTANGQHVLFASRRPQGSGGLV